MTRNLGICGYPIDHSLSPHIHGALYAALDLPWEYGSYPCPDEESFRDLIQGIRRGETGLPDLGLNVTTPFKGLAAQCVDRLDASAASCLSVNTVLVEEDGGQRRLVGFNTDGSASRALLEQKLGGLDGQSLLICGTGSLAASLVVALGEAGARLVLVGRSTSSLDQLSQRVSSQSFQGYTYDEVDVGLMANCRAFINVTTVGMELGQSLPLEPLPGMLVMDAVYASGKTSLLQRAGELGCPVIDGIDLLVQQALEADLIWSQGAIPDLAHARALMREATDPASFA